MRAPPGGIAGGARCVLERSSEMRDEGLPLRWTADHNAAAYERPRCAVNGHPTNATAPSMVRGQPAHLEQYGGEKNVIGDQQRPQSEFGSPTILPHAKQRGGQHNIDDRAADLA